ncbi:hypothetical protein BS47DRAFT_1381762 [Hydnum rufescens UP504]|uniref:Uncharacterized protein n=1 Tax=Hydnum rufescens UP504 TaxID=1448309 RepID=A0A9P6AZD9_9AGAM|nr:hypothetical protein BS47DRAFT_1381762 [Hydnum rufescens UP504]
MSLSLARECMGKWKNLLFCHMVGSPPWVFSGIGILKSDANVDQLSEVNRNRLQKRFSCSRTGPKAARNTVKEIQWISFTVLTITPILAVYGAFTTKLWWETALFSVFWSMSLGITAGYHHLWAQHAYNASKPLKYFLAIAGAGAVQGSINDLANNPTICFQHRWYLELLILVTFIIPTIVPGLLWDDYRGGYFYAGAACLLLQNMGKPHQESMLAQARPQKIALHDHKMTTKDGTTPYHRGGWSQNTRWKPEQETPDPCMGSQDPTQCDGMMGGCSTTPHCGGGVIMSGYKVPGTN